MPNPRDELEWDVAKLLLVVGAVSPPTGGVIVNSGMVVEWLCTVSAKASEESEEEYEGASGESMSLVEIPESLPDAK